MVMKFIYLGQCEVGHSELTDFLNIGKALEIHGLMENIEMEEEDEEPVPEKEQQHPPREYPRNNIQIQDINLDDVTWEIASVSPVEKEIVNIQPGRKNVNGKYPCDQCDGKYYDQSTLR